MTRGAAGFSRKNGRGERVSGFIGQSLRGLGVLPPLALVFGTGLVRMPQMVRAGLVLNLAGIVVITALGWWLVPRVVAAH